MHGDIPLSRRLRLQEAIMRLPGLVMYYPMNETNGIVCRNYARSTLGTLNGVIAADTTAPLLGQNGKVGRAYTFDGINDVVTRENASLYNLSAYSLIIMIKDTVGDNNDKRIYGEGNSASNTAIVSFSMQTSGKITIFFRDDSNTTRLSATSTKVISNSNWHLLGFSDVNGTASLFIDGIVDATNFSYTKTGTYTLNRSSIGALYRQGLGNWYKGSIQHVAGLSTGLTAAQQLELANIAGFA